MKNLFMLLCFVFLTNTIFGQDFTVTIPQTDSCAGYIVPLKSGASYPLSVNVKNNQTNYLMLQ